MHMKKVFKTAQYYNKMFVMKNSDILYSKHILSKGHGFKTPQMCSVCEVMFLTGISGCKPLFKEHSKVMIIGDADDPVEQVIEDCLRTMKEEEKCVLKFKLPRGTVGKITQVNNSDEFLSGDIIELTMQLLSFTHREIWEIDSASKLKYAAHHKQRGVDLYLSDNYQPAFKHFGLSLKFLISYEHDKFSENEDEQIKELKISVYLNLAACQIKHYNYDSVAINATKALKLNPNNVKALYRRGVAYVHLQEYEKADIDLKTAKKLEPRNMAVAKALVELNERVKQQNQVYAKVMKKMFS